MWIRSATSNTWGMLWLMSITGNPSTAYIADQLEHLADSLTPSAAVGSSMITT